MQGRMSAGRDKQADRGYHLRCEHGVLGACAKISGGMRIAEREDVCNRFSDGGGVASELEAD